MGWVGGNIRDREKSHQSIGNVDIRDLLGQLIGQCRSQRDQPHNPQLQAKAKPRRAVGTCHSRLSGGARHYVGRLLNKAVGRPSVTPAAATGHQPRETQLPELRDRHHIANHYHSSPSKPTKHTINPVLPRPNYDSTSNPSELKMASYPPPSVRSLPLLHPIANPSLFDKSPSVGSR